MRALAQMLLMVAVIASVGTSPWIMQFRTPVLDRGFRWAQRHTWPAGPAFALAAAATTAIAMLPGAGALVPAVAAAVAGLAWRWRPARAERLSNARWIEASRRALKFDELTDRGQWRRSLVTCCSLVMTLLALALTR